MIPEWNFESRVILEKLMRQRGKLFIYEYYLERKENLDMLYEDIKKNGCTKKVRFSIE